MATSRALAGGEPREPRPGDFWRCNMERRARGAGQPWFGWALLAPAALGVGLLGGCSADEVECRVGADCASGICRSDGTCVPLEPGGGGAGGAGASGGATGGGGSNAAGAGGTGGAGAAGGGSNTCLPNHDGTIERREIPLRAGLDAKFMTALDVTVDTAGDDLGDGTRAWDWSASLEGDALGLVETREIDGEWFAESFPGASYAALLSATEELLGVFEITEEQLLLRGVVSPDDGLYRTELTYDPPIVVVDFPLTRDKSWSSSATVSGVAMGVYSYYTEDYEYEVDAEGTMVVPYGTFDVLRTRVLLTRTIGYLPTTIRSFAFTAECFSTVASVSSQNNETEEQFASAAEVRRLAP